MLVVVSSQADEEPPAKVKEWDDEELPSWVETANVTDDEPARVFERTLADLAKGVAQHAKKMSDKSEEGKYLESVSEALGDEDLVKMIAERCSRMLRDPSVKLQFKLSVVPSGSTAQSALRDTLSGAEERPTPSNVPASLMQWMGLTSEPKKKVKRSSEAADLLSAFDDVVVDTPKDTDARCDLSSI